MREWDHLGLVIQCLTYTDSNSHIWNLAGGGGYVLSTGGNQCPPSGPTPSSTVPLTGGWGFNIQLNPGPTDYPAVSYVTVPAGYIGLKYIVTSVTYAPPGPSSYVQYGYNTVTGNQTSISSSFTSQNSVTQSANGKAGISLPMAGGSFAIGWNSSITQTNTATATLGNSYTYTTDLQNNQAYNTPGYAIPYSGFWESGFNPHDSDVVWLWLNADQIYNTPSSGNVTWLGYGWDACDPVNGIDMYYVGEGYLDGDWPYIDLPGGTISALERGWTTTIQPSVPSTCNTQSFPSGSGPNITHGSNSDFTQIAAADPLLSQSYALNLQSNGQTSGDGRYTRFAGYIENNGIVPPAETDLVYEQALPGSNPAVATGDMTLTSSSDVGQSSTYSNSQTFGWDESFNSSSWLTNFTESLSTSNTITSTYTTKQDLTTSTSIYANFYIVSPPCNVVGVACSPIYNGPTEFDIYQDNKFGTFMFWPLNGL